MSTHYFDQSFRVGIAENYERYFVPVIGRPLAADLVRRAQFAAGDRVIDVACGTGVVTRLAAEHVGATGTVVGLDVNRGMIAVARSVAPPGSAVDWRVADAARIPFADESFDVALCQVALQFMADRVAVLREMRRVLVSGGRVLLSVPGPTPRHFALLADAMARHIAPEAAGFVLAIFALHDIGTVDGYLREAGFSQIQVEAYTRTIELPAAREYLWQYVGSTPLAPLVAGASDEARAALQEEVLPAWQKLETDDLLRYRQRVVVARAVR